VVGVPAAVVYVFPSVQELDEVQAALDRLTGEHEALQAAHDVMLRETDGQLVALEAVLADNLAKSAALADKLSTAEVGLHSMGHERRNRIAC